MQHSSTKMLVQKRVSTSSEDMRGSIESMRSCSRTSVASVMASEDPTACAVAVARSASCRASSKTGAGEAPSDDACTSSVVSKTPYVGQSACTLRVYENAMPRTCDVSMTRVQCKAIAAVEGDMYCIINPWLDSVSPITMHQTI